MGWEEGAVTVDLTGTKELDSRMLALTVDRGSLTVIIPTDQWTEAYSEVMLGAQQPHHRRPERVRAPAAVR